MREGYPVCEVAFPTSQLFLKPDDIVATSQKTPAEVTTYTVHINYASLDKEISLHILSFYSVIRESVRTSISFCGYLHIIFVVHKL